MKILVTGSEGFIGKHLVKALEEAGHVVVRFDIKIGADIRSTHLLDDVDRVVHLAAQTDAFCEDVLKDADTNIIGSIRLMERYKEKLVFVSSVMSKSTHAPYAISKRAGELYAQYFGCQIVRLCNIYGEGGHSAWDKFRDGESITIYGDGMQTREYAPVERAVAAIIDVLKVVRADGIFEVRGETLTVSQIAAKFPGKPVTFAPARRLDISSL